MKNYWDDIQLAANEDLPWEKLSGCNVLVTGATGLIGGCLVEVLMARGDINSKSSSCILFLPFLCFN